MPRMAFRTYIPNESSYLLFASLEAADIPSDLAHFIRKMAQRRASILERRYHISHGPGRGLDLESLRPRDIGILKAFYA